jgi:hypothetical protein
MTGLLENLTLRRGAPFPTRSGASALEQEGKGPGEDASGDCGSDKVGGCWWRGVRRRRRRRDVSSGGGGEEGKRVTAFHPYYRETSCYA